METNQYNFDLIEDRVATQYGDYAGYIQVDGHSGSDLFKLCEDHGIDMKNYFLIGFGFGESTINGVGKSEKILCTALLLETSLCGSTFDEIAAFLRQKNGKAKAKKVHFHMKIKDLSKYVKRFDLMVVTRLSTHIKELDVTDVFY
jgi:hypothetical protein